jgi:TonB family protein
MPIGHALLRACRANFLLWSIGLTICLSLASIPNLAEDKTSPALATALRDKYLHKVFTLRAFYSDEWLHFDSDGNPRGHMHPASWTLAMVEIEDVRISGDEVELKGSRWAESYDSKQSNLMPLRTPQKVRIVIDRDVSVTESALIASIDRLFLGATDRMIDLVPDYWKAYLSGLVEAVPQENGRDCYRVKGRVARTENGTLQLPCDEHAKTKSASQSPPNVNNPSLSYTGKGIEKPRALFQPSPQGPLEICGLSNGITLLSLTVNADGSTGDIQIVKPLGCGADDKAEETVKTWKFKPARLNGQAVPVDITVEVSFHRS